jgi:ABC-type multidrug transport system fused ATPase/permease subunit
MMSVFELTENHIKLLSSTYIYFYDDCYEGVLCGDSKRPYGNSDITGDIYEILNGYRWEPEDDEDYGMPDDLKEEMLAIHRETATALQIILSLKTFEPGTYEKERSYDDLSWKRVEEKKEIKAIKDKLTITIKGKAGSGKTHLLAYITKLLHKEGFDVAFDDVDLDFADIKDFGTKEAICSIKQKSKIELKTELLPR